MNIKIDPESLGAVQGDEAYAGRLTAIAEKNLAKAKWHLHPWKSGTWVNLEGTVYEGNGGGEGEENFWAQRGPWLLLNAADVNRLTSYERRAAKKSDKRARALEADIAALVIKHGIEIGDPE